MNSTSPNIHRCLSSRNRSSKHENCEICKILPDEYSCSVYNIVYEFKCRTCNANYIGKTSRSFKVRCLEHKRSITNEDNKSAFCVHLHDCAAVGMSDFDVIILQRARSSIDVALLEAREIQERHPTLNRRHELIGF